MKIRMRNKDLKNILYGKAQEIEDSLVEIHEIEKQIELLQDSLKQAQEKEKNKLKLMAYLETVAQNIPAAVFTKQETLKEFNSAMATSVEDIEDLEKNYGFKNWRRI